MTSPVQEIVVSVNLAASAALLYASPLGVWTQITKLTCTNTDAASHAVTFHIVPSGASATTANKSTILKAILSGDTWNSPNEYGLVLNPGDALWGFADTGTVVNAFVSAVLASA